MPEPIGHILGERKRVQAEILRGELLGLWRRGQSGRTGLYLIQ